MQKKFLRAAFYGIQTKEHKQENLSSRKRRRFKQELKAEEGEESPLKSWVKVQRLNTQYGRTQTVQHGSRTARRVRDEDGRLTEAPLKAHPVQIFGVVSRITIFHFRKISLATVWKTDWKKAITK